MEWRKKIEIENNKISWNAKPIQTRTDSKGEDGKLYENIFFILFFFFFKYQFVVLYQKKITLIYLKQFYDHNLYNFFDVDHIRLKM